MTMQSNNLHNNISQTQVILYLWPLYYQWQHALSLLNYLFLLKYYRCGGCGLLKWFMTGQPFCFSNFCATYVYKCVYIQYAYMYVMHQGCNHMWLIKFLYGYHAQALPIHKSTIIYNVAIVQLSCQIQSLQVYNATVLLLWFYIMLYQLATSSQHSCCLMLFSMSQNWLLHRVFWAVRVFAGAPVANPITAATAVLPCWSSTTPTDLAILNVQRKMVSCKHQTDCYQLQTNIVVSSLGSSSPSAYIIVDTLVFKVPSR